MPSRRQAVGTLVSTVGLAVAGCLGSDDDESGGGSNGDNSDGEGTGWLTAGYDRANTNHVPDMRAIRGVSRTKRFDSGLNATQSIVAEGTLYHSTDRLSAVDLESGEERWAVAPEDGQGNFWAAPTVHGGTVYLANGHQRVHAVDAENGEKRWTTELDVGTRCSPSLDHDGEALFVGGDGHVSRLDTETGDVVWTRDLFGQFQETLASHRGVVYAVSEGGELYALDEYGDGYWRVDLPAKCQTPPTVAERHVYVGTFDGFVHAIDTSRASIAWSTEVGGFAKGGIAVDDDTVYADGGRTLHAMDADTGEKRWEFDVGTTGNHTPVVAGDTVFTTGEKLYALKPDGGFSNGRIREEMIRFTHATGGYGGPMSVADGRLFVTARLDEDQSNTTDALLILEST